MDQDSISETAGAENPEPALSEEDEMKQRANPISQAMAAVDFAEDVEQALTEAIPGPAVFNTHSTALVGMLLAQENALREKAADIRKKITDLEAEYTDIMLAQSGVTHAIRAIHDGAG
jgi:molecular chaperone DnaK (HSP70)